MDITGRMKKQKAAKQAEIDTRLVDDETPTIDGNTLLEQLQAAKRQPTVTTTIVQPNGNKQPVQEANLGAIQLAGQTAQNAEANLKYQRDLEDFITQQKLKDTSGFGFDPSTSKTDEQLRQDAAFQEALKKMKLGAQ